MSKKVIFILSLISLVLLTSSVYAFCIDRDPPSAPTNLVIHDSPYDGDGNITLTWTAATDGPCPSSAVAYYNISRSNDGGNFTLIGTNTTPTSFNDFSSLPEGKYWYRVAAVDNVMDNPHEGPAVEGSTTVGQIPPTTTSTTPSGGGGGGILPTTTTTIPATTTVSPTGQTITTTLPSPQATTTTTLPLSPLAITGFISLVVGNTTYQLLIVLAVVAVLLTIFRRGLIPLLKRK